MPAGLRARSPADTGDDDEAALVAGAQSDPRAFAPLYRRYADPVYRYCYRHLGSREAAEDATSQIFTRALAALPGLGERPFRPWLFVIAAHAVVDVHRARRPEATLDAAVAVVDPAPSPEEQAMAAADGRAILAALARLSAADRRLVELRLAGLSGAEIAAVLGRSPGAVRVAHHRAVARLRALRAEQGGEGAPDA
jgi:RNA polymerase sigma-70 factor (ECF subfamily)